MKIRHLHINNFGHFADRDVALSDAGLQIIYGPNEAGKTTLLEFLRGWLFDFPTRTPYDFRAGGEIGGVGTLVLADGRFVELRRRKGNKNKVSVKIDGRPTHLDEAGFAGLIGHANRNLFESIFAFGLTQLSQGEESLKHESLQSALFGGGLASAASPEQIEDALDAQAAELFSPSARKPAINQLLGEIKQLAAEIRDKSLRSADYQAAQAAVGAADARAAEIQQEVDRLRREHARAEKLLCACPKWWEWRQQRARRAQLSVPIGLPLDARERFAAIVQRLAETDAQHRRLAADIGRDERELAALRLDPQSVSLRAEIKAALELRQSTVDARRDLPDRLHQRAATERQIDRELDELRPGWCRDDLLAFSVDVASRAAIDRLVDEDRAIGTARAALRARREGLDAQLVNAEADLAALGQPCDATPLEAALADESTYLTDCKQHENQRGELAKIERQLAAALRKLTPPLPSDAGSPANLPVPREETVADFDAWFADLGQQLRLAVDSLKEDAAQLGALQDKLAQATAGHAVPSLSERDARRHRRDAGWDLIRRRYVEGQPAPDAETAWIADASASLIEAYQRAVRAADEIADQIYANADAVARREESGRQHDAMTRRIAQKQAGVDELKRQEADLRARWRALWEPCGFEPLSPDAMRHWLADHQTACETTSRRDDVTAQIELLGRRKTAFEDRIRAASGQADAEIAVLLTSAHRAVDGAKDHRRRSADLRQSLERLRPRLAACDDELKTLDQRQAAWRAEWQSILAGLSLPSDWGTELARTVIERLTATRVKLDGLPHEEDRIRAMQARISEFEAQVRPLCERLAPELLRDPAELAIEKISEQLDLAIEAEKLQVQLQKHLAASREQFRQVEEHRQSLVAGKSDLFASAEAASEAQFLEVVERAQSIRTLDADVERLAREIELIRAGDDRDAFQQSLAEVQQGELQSQCRDLAERLQAAEAQKRDADQGAGAAKEKLRLLDGSGEAALLTERLACKRAELAAGVDRYVPLLLARHLLAESVRRFEAENQPEMIATVSRLINEITAGRYIKFDRTGGKEIILHRFDGVELTPDQLSVGTHNQLYLAIRLAYVLHYCRQNEPLPIVMDDVLVNFDPQRARQTLAVLSDVARSVQVLFFTCHPHMIALAEEVVPGLQPIELAAPSPTAT